MTESAAGDIRLHVYLARAGVASRRAAERLILEGRVAVNGRPATELGTKVGPRDRIELDGRLVTAQEPHRYLLLNKPAGYLCAMSDPEGRPLAVDLIKASVSERVYNVGRLDQWSSGLVLFTNDGELAARLLRPASGIDKEYAVVADEALPEEFFRDFERGIDIEGVRYRAARIERSGPTSARVVLIEGKNREIRRVLEHFGRRARTLCRTRIGPLRLDGLAAGAFRELTRAEVDALRSYGA